MTSPAPDSILCPGTLAPDFSLATEPGKSLRLSDFRGKPVVLVFYPADWSPVCGDQLALYNEILSEFEKFNARLLAISVDGAYCHVAYRKNRNLDITLLADFEPKGAVSRLYGAYDPQIGWSNRALFVIDAKGVIRWSFLSPTGVNPGANGILAALEELEPSKGTLA
jgi:peroxiredoxin